MRPRKLPQTIPTRSEVVQQLSSGIPAEVGQFFTDFGWIWQVRQKMIELDRMLVNLGQILAQICQRLRSSRNFGEIRANSARDRAEVDQIGPNLIDIAKMWSTPGHTWPKSGHVSAELAPGLPNPSHTWQKSGQLWSSSPRCCHHRPNSVNVAKI